MEYTPEFLEMFKRAEGRPELVVLNGGATRRAPSAQELARQRRLSLRVDEARRQMEAAEKFARMAKLRYIEALAEYDRTIVTDAAAQTGRG